jgi:hypothetical protein
MAEDSGKEKQAHMVRALSEKCFLAGNISGARQWMQSAVRLAPELPGTAQAVAAYDVHAAAARRPVDWYAVLGLLHPPRSSGDGGGDVLAHDNIKRQHRRLCLLVHPDKNPSAAADGAFKLVQADWEALSARHPPADDDAPAQQPGRPPPRPPDPPQPQPRQQPRGGAHQQVRRPSYADAARPAQPQGAARGPEPPSPPRAQRVIPPPPATVCPSCGALTPNGKRSLRCMVCHWRRPKVRWHVSDFYKK